MDLHLDRVGIDAVDGGRTDFRQYEGVMVKSQAKCNAEFRQVLNITFRFE